MLVFVYLVVVLVLANSIECETEIRCTEEYCEKYREDEGCPELSEACRAMNATHHGTHLPYPEVCNCCNYCLTNIPEGDACTIGSPGTPVPVDICGPGLICAGNDEGLTTCQKMSSVGTSPCSKDQQSWDERRAQGKVGFLEIRPKCNDDGFYEPAHCIPGSICYCRSPTGERIFGEQPFLDSSDEMKMTCGCSLIAWKARQTVDFDNWAMEKVQIFTARCTSIGLFDQLQCMLGDNADCTCVEEIEGYPDPLPEIVKIKDIKEGQPKCFDPKRHQPGQYTTPCESMKLLTPTVRLSRKNLFIDPDCQPDGMFGRVQIKGTKKICVDPLGNQISHNDGTQIINYEADLDAPEAKTMKCNCARTLWLLSQANITELPKCTNSGDYDELQCRRNKCYCVDADDGNQTELEVDLDDVYKLTCYKKF